MELIFIDTETTGLDPITDEILSISWRVTDMHGEPPARELRARDVDTLLFVPAREPSPEVAEINGYNAANWIGLGAEEFNEHHAEHIADSLANRYWVGSHPRFDFDFISAAMRRVSSRKLRPLTHHLIDLGSIAWPLIVAGKLPGPNQRQLTKSLLERDQQHSSSQDVTDMIDIYRLLMRRADVWPPAGA